LVKWAAPFGVDFSHIRRTTKVGYETKIIHHDCGLCGRLGAGSTGSKFIKLRVLSGSFQQQFKHDEPQQFVRSLREFIQPIRAVRIEQPKLQRNREDGARSCKGKSVNGGTSGGEFGHSNRNH
jgi:hypothetical protein